MVTKVAAKQDAKLALLQVGMELMLEKGYSNTGIQEVLTASNIPKGSFYHYFDSKEQFAVAIIHYFDSIYTGDIEQMLSNTKRSPIERLREYCQSAAGSGRRQSVLLPCISSAQVHSTKDGESASRHCLRWLGQWHGDGTA